MNIQEIASASAMIKQELAPLAEKIGEGVEFTYGLFKRQVYVSSIIDLLWIVPGSILLSLGKKWWKSSGRMKKQDEYSQWEMAYFTSAICFVIGLMSILIPVRNLIATLINPDYQAIKLILSTIKGGI